MFASRPVLTNNGRLDTEDEDILDDPWLWYGNTFAYQLTDPYFDPPYSVAQATVTVSSATRFTTLLDSLGLAQLDNACLLSHNASIGNLLRSASHLSSRSGSEDRRKTEPAEHLQGQREPPIWNGPNDETLRESYLRNFSRESCTPRTTPIWPYTTQNSLFGNASKQQESASTRNSEEICARTVAANSETESVDAHPVEDEEPPEDLPVLREVVANEGIEETSVSVVINPGDNALGPGGRMPDLPPPNGFCAWNDEDDKRMMCYIQTPSQTDDAKELKSLALWILNTMPGHPPTLSELDWIKGVDETARPDTLQLDLEDHAELLTLQFNDPKVQVDFQQHADRAATAVSLVEERDDPEKLDLVYDAALAPETLNVQDVHGNLLDSIHVDGPSHAAALCAAVERLKKRPLKRLPSIVWNWRDSLQEMMKYAHSVTPEALYLVHGTEVTVLRRGVSMSESSNLLRMRMLASLHGGVALETLGAGRQVIPANIDKLHNYHHAYGHLDLASLIRSVPKDPHTFLLSLKHDEDRRLLITDFQSMIYRWAVGDVLDSVSYYGCVSNFASSITVHERRVAHLLRTYLRKGKSGTGRDLIRVAVQASSNATTPGSTRWLPVRVQDNRLVWANEERPNDGGGGGGATPSPVSESSCSLTSVEWVKREGPKTVHIKFEGNDVPLLLYIARPKIQCLFGEYVKVLIARKELIKLLHTKRSKEEVQDGQDGAALITHLVDVCREQCLLLSRLNVSVHSYYDNNLHDTTPAHFNMICTRIVPDRGTASRFSSLDLRRLIGVRCQSEHTAKIKLGPLRLLRLDTHQATDDFYEEVYALQFPTLLHLFAFQRLCHHILLYYGRDNIYPAKQLQGRAIFKPGVRVAQTKALRQGRNSKSKAPKKGGWCSR